MSSNGVLGQTEMAFLVAASGASGTLFDCLLTSSARLDRSLVLFT